MTRSMNKHIKNLCAAFASLGVLQLSGCSLFEGGLLERTLTGAAIDPLTQSVYDLFFSFATGG